MVELRKCGGCIPVAPFAGRHVPRLSAPRPVLAMATGGQWSPFVCPADDQGQTSTCAGWGLANEREIRARHGAAVLGLGGHAVPTGKSIDGAMIHRVAVESSPRYTADSGITIPDAMTASRTLNIHPHGSYLMRVERTRAAVCEAIGRGPLVVGLCVNEAWTDGDETEVYIDPTEYPIQPDNGHCVIVADILWQGGQPYALIVNSWGRKWRWQGLCLMHVDALLSTMLGEECYVVDYAGTETDNGWMRNLIRVPE